MSKTILISREGLAGAYKFVTEGWCNAFSKIGCKTILWDGHSQSIANEQIDLFLGCSGHKQVFPQNLRDRYGTKIGIHVNPFGVPIISQPGWPNLNENHSLISWVKRQNPDFLFYYGVKGQKQYWKNWTQPQLKLIPLPTAGDSTKYFPFQGEQVYDIGYVGMRWSYKSLNIDKWLLPVILQYNVIVYGSGAGSWDVIGHQYKGSLTERGERNFIAGCKITPCVVEPHTTKYGIDIPERMFKAPLCGSMVVCDLINNLHEYVNIDDFNMCKTPKEYLKLCKFYLDNPQLRKDKLQKQQAEILRNHSYFSRIKALLEAAGFPEDAMKAQAEIDKQIKHHNNGERWI